MSLSAYIEDIDHKESEHKFYGIFGRDYEPEYMAFADKMRDGAISTGAPCPTQYEIASAYGRETMREERELEAVEEDAARRDRQEVKSKIAADCIEFTSAIPSHLAFKELHELVEALQCSSRHTFYSATVAAELHLAVKSALENEPVLAEFYRLWESGAADNIAPHVLARSKIWHRVMTLVGEEILRRRLLHIYKTFQRECACPTLSKYARQSLSSARG